MTKAEAIFVLEHIEAHNGLAEEAKLMAIDALKKPDIIRCEDCKFWNRGECDHPDGLVLAYSDYFCNYGKRKEKTDE